MIRQRERTAPIGAIICSESALDEGGNGFGSSILQSLTWYPSRSAKVVTFRT